MGTGTPDSFAVVIALPMDWRDRQPSSPRAGKKKASKPPVRRARVSKAANVDEKPSAIPAPAQHSTINYSKFDLIDVSDEEEEDPVTGPSALEHGPHHLHEGAMEGSSGEGCPMCGADHSAIESNSPATAPSDEEEDSGDDGTDTVVRQDEDGGTLVSMKVVPGLLDSPGFERALKKGFLKGGRPSSSSSSGPAKTRVGEADGEQSHSCSLLIHLQLICLV